MNELHVIQKIAISALPVLFAITAHEAAHGWVANRLGDPTAKQLGRITLNPLKHIDPIGTVLVPLVMYLTTEMMFDFPLLFGWAKPVPVNWGNLRNPRRDIALVSIAGPGANLIMALIWVVVAVLGYSMLSVSAWMGLPLMYMGTAGIMINTVLMVLNLMPILPLDGGRITTSLLPPKLAASYARLEPWGMFIVIGLLASGIFRDIINPVLSAFQYAVIFLVNLQ